MDRGTLDQLLQIIFSQTGVWDGDLVSKAERDLLIRAGIVEKAEGGYNILTTKAQLVVDRYLQGA